MGDLLRRNRHETSDTHRNGARTAVGLEVEPSTCKGVRLETDFGLATRVGSHAPVAEMDSAGVHSDHSVTAAGHLWDIGRRGLCYCAAS